jgi:hypothetical protein
MSLSIVQFLHPGGEHKPDKYGGNIKSWNQGEHRRKFMLAPGSYVEEVNGKETYQQGNLLFWGEWEPPSEVHPIANKIKTEKETVIGIKRFSGYPEYLHKPYLPLLIPKSTPTEPYQNTDPFVFGDQFRYFLCRQSKKDKKQIKRPTELARLDKGSLILFGSKKDGEFVLDTVFVVADYKDYNFFDPNALPNEGLYQDIVIKMSCGTGLRMGNPLMQRLYYGATYEKPYQGMYSFAPAQKATQPFAQYKATDKGFPRVTLTDFPYITQGLMMGFKTTQTNSNSIETFWQNIRQQSRDQGCVEGVHFDMPPTP